MDIQTRYLADYTRNVPCSNFFVTTLIGRRQADAPHRHDCYQIILLTKGEAKHLIDFELKEMKAPSLSLVFPKQIHRLKLSEDAEAVAVMFDETIFCTEILANELKDYNIDLQKKCNLVDLCAMPERMDDLLSFVAHIQDTYSGDALNPARKYQIKFMIKIMLLKIFDALPSDTNPKTNDSDRSLYIRFRQKVDEQYRDQRKVQQYAADLGVSAKKLTAVCHSYGGMSPLEIIHEKLSLELRKLFVGEALSLKEIAFQLGFSSQSALNKYIEQEFQCTPMEFRQSVLKKTGGEK